MELEHVIGGWSKKIGAGARGLKTGLRRWELEHVNFGIFLMILYYSITCIEAF